MEEKSKTSKKRVHYMKFTKGGFIMRRQWSEMNRNKCAKIYDAKHSFLALCSNYLSNYILFKKQLKCQPGGLIIFLTQQKVRNALRIISSF